MFGFPCFTCKNVSRRNFSAKVLTTQSYQPKGTAVPISIGIKILCFSYKLLAFQRRPQRARAAHGKDGSSRKKRKGKKTGEREHTTNAYAVASIERPPLFTPALPPTCPALHTHERMRSRMPRNTWRCMLLWALAVCSMRTPSVLKKKCRFRISDILFDHPSYSNFLFKFHLFCYYLFYHYRYFDNDLFIL
jgi:hypothetical protein